MSETNKQNLAKLGIPIEGSNVRPRCWGKKGTECQVLSRSVCPKDCTDYGLKSAYWPDGYKRRCTDDLYTNRRKCCRPECAGGCSFSPRFDSILKSSTASTDVDEYLTDARDGRDMWDSENSEVDRTDVAQTCTACQDGVNIGHQKAIDTQYAYNYRCIVDSFTCKTFGVPGGYSNVLKQSFEEEESEEDITRSKHKYCLPNAECPQQTLYDEQQSDCVNHCAEESLEFRSLTRAIGSDSQCYKCQDVGVLENLDPLDLNPNGYQCTINIDPLDPIPYGGESLRICYGPGNPHWKTLLEKETGETSLDSHTAIRDKTLQYLEGCDILDGNFEMMISAYIDSEYRICKAVRNLRVITGYVRINAYPGDTLDCFERLQYIGGKTTTMLGYILDRGLSLQIRQVATHDPGQHDLKYLGLRLARNGILWGNVHIDHGPLSSATDKSKALGHGICYVTDGNIFNYWMNTTTCQESPTTRKSASGGRCKIESKCPTKEPDCAPLRYLEKHCPHNNTCGDECANGICIGPDNSDCMTCKNFNDTSVLDIGSDIRQRIPAVYGNYNPESFLEFSTELKVNPFKWECVAQCPKTMTYAEGNKCYPCHKECHPDQKCKGKENHDCLRENDEQPRCRNDVVNFSQLSEEMINEHKNCSARFDSCVENATNDETCVADCKNITICRTNEMSFGKEKLDCISESRYYTDVVDNIPTCTECHSSCRFFGCINGDSGEDGGCGEGGCWEEMKGEGDERRYRYHGLDCADMLPNCEINCEHKYGCELDINGEVVRCFDKPWPVQVIVGVFVSVILTVAIAAVVLYTIYKKEREKQRKLNQNDIKMIVQQTYGVAVNENTIPRTNESIDHRRFTGIKVYTNDQVTLEKELGRGNFACVYKGLLTITHVTNSQPSGSAGSRGDSTSELVQGSQRSKQKIKQIKFHIAVKELNADPGRISVKMVLDNAARLGVRSEEQLATYRRQLTLHLDSTVTSERLSPEQRTYLKRLHYATKEKELIQEVTNVAPLRHKHLIRLLGIVSTSETASTGANESHFEPPRMLTDFAENGELPGYIKRKKSSLDERHVATWASQIADAMAYLEKENIVHRDLAARNILVMGDAFNICVSDFGLAKMISQNESDDRYKMATDMPLPVKWYAPECINPHPSYSHKSDVWSYGITLWEILTFCEKTPYDDEEEYIKLARHLNGNSIDALRCDYLFIFLFQNYRTYNF